jgi:Big-like domain-containing protein
MSRIFAAHKAMAYRGLGPYVRGILACLLAGLSLAQLPQPQLTAEAGIPLRQGYLDFSYADNASGAVQAVNEPTGIMVESKLWWNDGFWWGSLYNAAADEFRIYRLTWGTQTWEDTGVALDDREGSRADVLWDEANRKLYVVSHEYQAHGSWTSNKQLWARLYRYTYDVLNQTYSLDSGFPVTVNQDRSKSLILDRDSAGRLWIAYASRARGSRVYQIFVNASQGDDRLWGKPYALPFLEARVTQDDIASLIAFRDTPGEKIGVMWSNLSTTAFHFATHPDRLASRIAGWELEASIGTPLPADAQLNLKSLPLVASDLVFAAVKTSTSTGSASLVALLVRDTAGTFSYHAYSTVSTHANTPLVVLDEKAGLVHVFVTGVPASGKICYQTAPLTHSPSAVQFPALDCGTSFLEGSAFNHIHNATTSKQSVNATTGLVILATDDVNGAFYVHSVIGDVPPVITSRGPHPNSVNVSTGGEVSATFSEAIQVSTLTRQSFKVTDSTGPVAGTLTFDPATRTAIFTPELLLQPNTTYTVTLTADIADIGGNQLYGAPEAWHFETDDSRPSFRDSRQ